MRIRHRFTHGTRARSHIVCAMIDRLVIRYHASWILPIAEPPIADGWFVADRGRIVAYGAYGAVTRRAPSHAETGEVELGHVAVLPGLVNAHTHLELSYLRDEI